VVRLSEELACYLIKGRLWRYEDFEYLFSRGRRLFCLSKSSLLWKTRKKASEKEFIVAY